MTRKYHLLLMLLLVAIVVHGQESEFLKKAYTDAEGNELRYRILYPEDYSPNKSYPLVIFLHGSGERGSNNEDQLIHGSYLFLDSINRREFPAFVVFPQCPEEERWTNVTRWREGELRLQEEPGKQMMLLFGMLDEMKEALPVDQSRIYLSGLSMGGFGTFGAIMRRPDEFAAALPICGGGDVTKADIISNIPMWIFHGAADSVVPADLSREMNQALLNAGSNVRYTEYEGVNHNSWDNAFAEEDFLNWMFSQVKE